MKTEWLTTQLKRGCRVIYFNHLLKEISELGVCVLCVCLCLCARACVCVCVCVFVGWLVVFQSRTGSWISTAITSRCAPQLENSIWRTDLKPKPVSLTNTLHIQHYQDYRKGNTHTRTQTHMGNPLIVTSFKLLPQITPSIIHHRKPVATNRFRAVTANLLASNDDFNWRMRTLTRTCTHTHTHTHKERHHHVQYIHSTREKPCRQMANQLTR